MRNLSKMPAVDLSNGICVANFSSPHPFTFEDGTVLPACEEDRVIVGSVSPMETLIPARTDNNNIKFFQVELQPRIASEELHEMLCNAHDDPRYSYVDIILVSLMLLEAIKEHRTAVNYDAQWHKCHAIRRPFRGANVVCAGRFCV